jgi:biotin carboxylase
VSHSTGRSAVLAIGGGGPKGHVADWSSLLAAQAARRQLDLVVADLEPNLASLPASVAAHAVAVDYTDPEACVAVARKVAATRRLVAVIGFREYALLSTAHAAEAVQLPWNSVKAISLSRTKDLCRERLREAGLPQPALAVFSDPADAVSFLDKRIGRWIIKPRDAFGSQGVALATKDSSENMKLTSHALTYSDQLIVEEFIEGLEYSVEGMVIDGAPTVLGITRKITSKPPYFVELGHQQPAFVSPAIAERLGTVARDAVQAVGLTHSLFHVEAWVRADGEIICGEVHSRTGGDWIHALTAFIRPGLELFGAVIDDIMNRPVPIPPVAAGRLAAVHVVTAPPGIVSEVSGVDEARKNSLAVDIRATPGTQITQLTDSFGRAALVVAGVTDGSDAGAAARRAAEKLLFTVS